MICSDGFGGVERYVSTLAPRLADRGVEVVVIGGAADAMREALEGGCLFVPAESIRDARAALRTLGAFDIVNTHMTEADVAGLMRPRPARSARHVSTRHFAAPRGSGLARAVLRLAARRIDREIAISRYVADSIGVDADIVVTGVVDAADVSTARSKTVLVAQRLEPEKATADALRAWAASGARTLGWRLVVAGSGSLREDLEREASALGVSDSVEFLGHRTDVADLMASSGILLAPTPREGLGIAVLEAMAHALPVVAAASGGHLETVGRVADPALFEPGDHLAAASQLDRLVGDDAVRDGYGERLQRFQRRWLGMDRWADETLHAYERTLAR